MKKLMIFFIAIFFIMSMSAYAGGRGVQAFGDVYYMVIDSNSVGTIGTPATNPGAWIAGDNPNVNINPGEALCIAVQNGSVPTQATDMILELTGTDLDDLELRQFYGDPLGVASLMGAPNIGNNFCMYPLRFVPQPEWHIIILINIDGVVVVVEVIIAKPHCYVPSLTTYGIAALALLLIASSVFVIYRRRKAVTA